MRLRDGLSLGSDVVIDNSTNITSKDFYVDSSLPTVKPTLNLNFAKTKSLDPRITFTRASTASYFDQYGVMKYAAINTPRFDHDPITGESLGLLFEETRTNLISYSEDFRLNNAEGGVWSSPTDGIIITSNATVSPDGSMSADKFTLTDTSTVHMRYRIHNWSYNTTYVGSVFVKSDGHRYAYVRLGNAAYGDNDINTVIDLQEGTAISNSTVSYGVIPLNNGWYRIWVVATTISSGIPSAVFAVGGCNSVGGTITGNNIDGIYVWGAQVEQGSYPTSYIPTTTSTVTRSADIATISASTYSSIYNPAEGTFVSTSNTAGYNATHGVFYSVLSGNDYISTRYVNTSRLNSVVVTSNTTVFTASSSATSLLIANEFVNASVAYKANDFGGYTKDVSASSSSGAVPATPSVLYIGNYNSSSQLNGHIKKLVYYPKRLSNATLQELTK